ncbi:MAG: hypothetical protein JO199_10240, partial [Candidatus Eremiobacteraeota bacterium]|nr:hypothetical protein [Candidatus Eremiobacteraeota bacterium]
MKFLSVAFFALLAAVTGAAAQASGLPAQHAYSADALRGRIVGALSPHAIVKVHVLLYGNHENELEHFIAMQNQQGSPAFERYLTPQEFGSYFGADRSTYERSMRILRGAGFTIVETANNRRDIVAQAPASTVEAFFQTPIDVHVLGTRAFFANRYEPVIPAALHAEVVAGLSNFRVMHSHRRVNPHGYYGGYVSFAPADLAVLYDLNPLYTAGLNGKGITLVNATSGAATASDLAGFEKTFKLPAVKLLCKAIDSSTCSTTCGASCDNGESTLDVDAATSVARNVTFLQVVAATPNDFNDVYKYIADSLGGTDHVVTTSWGTCEQDSGGSDLTLDETYFKQAATEGQWWFSAAGDNGTDDCQDMATKAVSVDYPGSSDYVVSVGGTDVHVKQTPGTYKVTAYVSESVWQYGNCGSSGSGSNGAGGGGKSIVFTKPSYQTAITPKDGRRDVPDVSLVSDDINNGLYVYQNGKIQGGNGGTSEAAPQWAALLSIVEQKKGNFKLVVDPHTRLYALGAPSTRAKYFHDVAGGNNGVPKCVGDIAVFPGY